MSTIELRVESRAVLFQPRFAFFKIRAELAIFGREAANYKDMSTVRIE